MSIDQRFETARHKRRAQVFMSGELIVAGKAAKITIRDISMDGAHIVCEVPLVLGAAVRLKRAGLEAAGEIAWIKKNEAGIKFDSPLEHRELQRSMPEAILKSLGTERSGKYQD